MSAEFHEEHGNREKQKQCSILHRLLEKDIFQTVIYKPSRIGVFSTFIILPVSAILYVAYTWYNSRDIISTSEISVIKQCMPINFTCTSKWGCEIGPFGNKTISKFNNPSGKAYGTRIHKT